MSEQNSEPRPFDPPTAPPAPPTAPPEPPAPPAPPAPERPQVPQYGEYAPVGYVSPVPSESPVAPANPYGVPGYAAPATPSNMYGVPSVAVSDPASPVRKRRTWDLVLTIILLVLGLFGMGLGIAYAAIFSNPEILSEAMSSQGFGTFEGSAGSAPVVLVVSHVVLFLIALGVSIALLVRRRIVVFWVPLAAGVIAAVIFWTTLASVLLSDPAFVSRVGA
jgi:hypothetical protein